MVGDNQKILKHFQLTTYIGILSTLKNLKKDVIEMRKGTECGMSFDDFKSFEPGDQIQCYETKSEKRRL